jgi:hypothetical protein
MSPVDAVKRVLKDICKKEGRSFDLDNVYSDPEDCHGGWMSHGSLACVVFEEGDLPKDYNHRDPYTWWSNLGDRVSELCGQSVYFEHYNHFVVNLYRG